MLIEHDIREFTVQPYLVEVFERFVTAAAERTNVVPEAIGRIIVCGESRYGPTIASLKAGAGYTNNDISLGMGKTIPRVQGPAVVSDVVLRADIRCVCRRPAGSAGSGNVVCGHAAELLCDRPRARSRPAQRCVRPSGPSPRPLLYLSGRKVFSTSKCKWRSNASEPFSPNERVPGRTGRIDSQGTGTHRVSGSVGVPRRTRETLWTRTLHTCDRSGGPGS
jgi:hypothetical protein